MPPKPARVSRIASAVRQALDWLRRNGIAQDGDFLVLAEKGRGVRSIECGAAEPPLTASVQASASSTPD